jgi:hypothetical protein
VETVDTPVPEATTWNPRVWSNDDAEGTTSTAYQTLRHVPAASRTAGFDAAPRSEIAELAESHSQVVTRSGTSVLPVLHTLTPWEKLCGPSAGLLESRPTTFHSIGVMVRPVAALAVPPTPTEARSSAMTAPSRVAMATV